MDHFYVVAGPPRSHPFATGDVALGADLRGDRLENRLDLGPGLLAAAGHHARSEPGAFLPAGHAGADVEQPLRLDIAGPPLGVAEVGIAAVDDDVARLENLDQLLDHAVGGGGLGIESGGWGGDRVARLDHQHHLARPGQRVGQLLERMRADDLAALDVCPVDEIVHLARGPVVDGNGETVVLHVQNEILAHHGQAHQADIALVCHGLSP